MSDTDGSSYLKPQVHLKWQRYLPNLSLLNEIEIIFISTCMEASYIFNNNESQRRRE
jgi:hypothetical protein